MKAVLITGCSSGYGLETARLAAFAQPAAVTTEADVTEAVWRAANDMSGQLRYPAGPDAVALAQHRQSGHLQA